MSRLFISRAGQVITINSGMEKYSETQQTETKQLTIQYKGDGTVSVYDTLNYYQLTTIQTYISYLNGTATDYKGTFIPLPEVVKLAVGIGTA